MDYQYLFIMDLINSICSVVADYRY